MSPLTGGEFGALLVADDDGRELVLKAIPAPELAARWEQGRRLATTMRTLGYPAPEYVGGGVTGTLCWSLQVRLPGAIPDVMSVAHAGQLIDLARRHEGAASTTTHWQAGTVDEMRASCRALAGHRESASLAGELALAVDRCAHAEMRDGDVVHADFHHRNFLAIGDDVTGVFDWELSYVGDWRLDLVNLACWAHWVPHGFAPEARAVVTAAVFAECPPEVVAFATAMHALRTIDFYARVHPDWLAWFVPMVDGTVAEWWRVV